MDEVIFANEIFFQNLIWILFCWNWFWFTAKYLPHVKILINRSYSKIKVNWHKNETHNGISWSQTVYCLPHSNSTVEQLTWVAYLKKRIAILIIINHLCMCKFPYFCMRKIKFVYFFKQKGYFLRCVGLNSCLLYLADFIEFKC